MSEKTAGYSVKHKRLGTKDLWKTSGLQLPAYIQNVANALMRDQGMDKSRAISTAVGTVKRWAGGGGKVGPEVRAAAAKAVAEWEAAKAKAHATPNKGSRSKNLARTGPAVELAVPVKGADGKTRFVDSMDELKKAQRASGSVSQQGQRKTVNYGSGPSQKARATAQSKGQAFQAGRYPVRNVADLRKAIQAFGRVKPEDKAALKRFIIRRARALGMANLIPSSWTAKELSSLHARVVELAGSRGPYQRHVAHTKQFGKKKGDLGKKADWSHEYNPKTPIAQALKAKHITNDDRSSSGAVKQGNEARVRMKVPPSAQPAGKSRGKAPAKPVTKPEAKSTSEGSEKSTVALQSRRSVLSAKVKAGTATPAERTELNAVIKSLQKRAKKS